MMASFVMGN